MDKAEITIFIVIANIVLLIFVAAAIIFLNQFRRRKLMHIRETEKLSALYEQQLLTAQMEVQQQTMQHIGREIHDNVGQRLTLASLYTQQLAYENKAPQVNSTIESIGHIINESLAELRKLSKLLTDNVIAESSIINLIEHECNTVNALKICTASFECNNEKIELAYQQKNIVLRVVQEFIQNSMKYANCKNICIRLQHSGNNVHILLKDDGIGFDKKILENKTGIGLLNMDARAKLLGGTFAIDTKVGEGVEVNFNFPLHYENDIA